MPRTARNAPKGEAVLHRRAQKKRCRVVSHPANRELFVHQGTAGNIPLAAAFTVVPIAIMAIYLTLAKRLGAFDAL